MKKEKILIIVLYTMLTCCLLLLTGCTNNYVDLKEYSVGDEVNLDNVIFNIYKLDSSNQEVYLFAQNNIATTKFSAEDRKHEETNNYEGSLVEEYVKTFVNDLESKGYSIKRSGIMDIDDLHELDFEHSNTLSGLPYLYTHKYSFVNNENNYWLADDYFHIFSYAWAYVDEKIERYPCKENEFGVRPIIVLDAKEFKRIVDEVEKDSQNEIE